MHEPTLKTEEEARNILFNHILPQYKNNLGRLALHVKPNNEFIGCCGLKNPPEPDEIYPGYRLVQKTWEWVMQLKPPNIP